MDTPLSGFRAIRFSNWSSPRQAAENLRFLRNNIISYSLAYPTASYGECARYRIQEARDTLKKNASWYDCKRRRILRWRRTSTAGFRWPLPGKAWAVSSRSFLTPIVKQVLMDSEVFVNFNYRTASLSDEADSLKFKFPVVFPATMNRSIHGSPKSLRSIS